MYERRKRTSDTYCNIYIIKNTVNDKVYIGQTWNTINSRFTNHKSKNLGCIKLINAFNAHGKENFNISLLTIVNTQEIANYWEAYFIAKFNSVENGYNLTSGGSSGKLKTSSLFKISASSKGRIVSKETKKKISIANKGRKYSDAFKAKLSEIRRGENAPWFGKSGKAHPAFGLKHERTQEFRDRISKMMAGKFTGENNFNNKLTEDIVAEIRQEYLIIKSSRKLALKYNVNKSTILRIINNKIWVID